MPMPSNREAFFARVRTAPFGGHMTQSQVDGIDAILAAAPDEMATEPLAYCFATAFHESGRTMQPVHEKGGNAYLSKYDTGKLAAALGNTPEADGDGILYAGRGYIQLTGRANYAKAGKELLADLVNHPELALQPSLAASIMFRGMSEGWFTGKKLSDYFGAGKSDPVGARHIVNGTDQAAKIAGYHSDFLAALRAGQGAAAEPIVIPPKPAPAKSPPITAPPVIVMGQGSIFARLAAAFREIFNEGH